MTCKTPVFYGDTGSSFTEPIDRLHSLPPPTRPHEESNIAGMDRGTSIRVDHAASGGSAGRQLEIEMGKTETVHDWGKFDRGCLPVGTGVDGRDSEAVRQGAGDGW